MFHVSGKLRHVDTVTVSCCQLGKQWCWSWGFTRTPKFWIVENPGKIPKTSGKIRENSDTDVSTPSKETEWNTSEIVFFSPNNKSWRPIVFSVGLHVYLCLFFGLHRTLWNVWRTTFIGQIWGNLGKILSHPQKYAYPYTCVGMSILSWTFTKFKWLLNKGRIIDRPESPGS